MGRVKGQKGFAPDALAKRKGRRAYAEAHADERAGRLMGPFDAKGAELHLATLSRKGIAKIAKR